MDEILRRELAALKELLETFDQRYPETPKQPVPIDNITLKFIEKKGFFERGKAREKEEAKILSQYRWARRDLKFELERTEEHLSSSPPTASERLKRLEYVLFNRLYRIYVLKPKRTENIYLHQYNDLYAVDTTLYHLRIYIESIAAEAEVKIRAQRLPAFLEQLHTWPRAILEKEIECCRSALKDVRNWRAEPLIAFSKIPLAPKFPPAEEVAFLEQHLALLERHLANAPEFTTPSTASPFSLSPGSGFKTFRLLASVDDPVAADNTRAMLNALARLQPNQVVFCLVGDGEAGEIYLTLTCPSPLAARVMEQLTTFYPNLVLEELPLDALATDYLAADYCLSHPNGLLKVFTDFNPDPFALFCSSLQDLRKGERVIFYVGFQPASNPVIYTDFYFDQLLQVLKPFFYPMPYPAELSEAELRIKQASKWAVNIQLLVSAPPSRNEAILQVLQRHLGQFSHHSTGQIQRWCQQQESRFVQNCSAVVAHMMRIPERADRPSGMMAISIPG